MRLVSPRLALEPLRVEDADEMVDVLADPHLYTFIGGDPPTLARLRDDYRRMIAGATPGSGQEWRNWIVRRRADGCAVGTVQATIIPGRRTADIAWVIGTPWQGQGYATEAARALVGWLDARGLTTISAHVHPNHRASAAVAARAGLQPTGETEDGEQVWRRLRDPGTGST
jgi:RimJ/RimL family protein N-acetyltransferase